MKKVLRHCGAKIRAEKLYQLSNYENYSQFFLLAAERCPACHKPVVGYAGYDLWGSPVLFDQNGVAVTPPVDGSGDPFGEQPAHLSTVGMARKKQVPQFLNLIASGEARPVERMLAPTRGTRGGMVGLSEYTRRAAGRNSREYVLGLVALDS